MDKIQQTVVMYKPDIPSEEFKNEKKITREKFKKIFERAIRDKHKIEKRKIWLDKITASKHYIDKKDHPLFDDVISYISSNVTEILLISWENSIKEVRSLALKMRSKYIWNNSKLYNMIHASDSLEESKRECELHFWIEKKQR